MILRIFIMSIIALYVSTLSATELLMVRSQQKFPEAMLTLQSSITDHGYRVTRVQRIDVGLTGMGYETDMYRVVFFGKADEIQYLVAKYPEIIPYMPPKISIFAENDETVLVTMNPGLYEEMISDPKDGIIFQRWASDIQSVFDDIRNAE